MRLLRKIKMKFKRLCYLWLNKAQAKVNPTYSTRNWEVDSLQVIDLYTLPSSYNKIIFQEEQVSKHLFDLLGSGEVRVHYRLGDEEMEEHKYPPLKVAFDFDQKGLWLRRFINRTNQAYSRKVWKFLKSINPLYEPIDWQLDFKSGYRWYNKTFYADIRYGHKLGVDVKVPWEISRFQHLSVLGLDYKATKDMKYALDYVSQILDWIATNPPMFGANWKCTMDVAIRVSNWLFWFGCIRDWVERQEWGDEFYKIFMGSLYDHLKFISENLEWGEAMTTNHYLSDIAGLLILTYSTENIFPESKRLRKFALEELKKEVFKHVYDDGCDFEASTCYHRLVVELFFFSTLLVVINDNNFNGENHREITQDIFGKEYNDKLYKMFDAVLYLLKPNGRMPQIGDNDSGQLFKLYSREVLDMRYLLSLGAVFFKESKWKIKEFFNSDEDIAEVLIIYGVKGKEIWESLEWNSIKNIKSKAFLDSGWYVMRDSKNYCIISCGQNGQNGNGGHCHNDKLSFELCIDGVDVIVDPGTYVYTPALEWRNKFRGTAFHNTVMIDGEEQNRFANYNLFSMGKDAQTKVVKFEIGKDTDIFVGEHYGYNRLKKPVAHQREMKFYKKKGLLEITDSFSGEGEHNLEWNFIFSQEVKQDINIFSDKLKWDKKTAYYSSEYGIKFKTKRFNAKVLKGLTEKKEQFVVILNNMID